MIDFTSPADILARTLWGEGRGTGKAGMARIASVILNRAAHPRWWGHDVLSVCLDPWQFSTWNPHTVGAEPDPNYRATVAVTADDGWFLIAQGIAADALAGRLPDTSMGGDSYYALSMKTPPPWAARARHTVSDGWHWFGAVELPAPSGEPEAACVSVAAPEPATPPSSADALNAAELTQLNGETTRDV